MTQGRIAMRPLSGEQQNIINITLYVTLAPVGANGVRPDFSGLTIPYFRSNNFFVLTYPPSVSIRYRYIPDAAGCPALSIPFH